MTLHFANNTGNDLLEVTDGGLMHVDRLIALCPQLPQLHIPRTSLTAVTPEFEK